MGTDWAWTARGCLPASAVERRIQKKRLCKDESIATAQAQALSRKRTGIRRCVSGWVMDSDPFPILKSVHS